MDREPLVSILMNCYNGEEYLKEAIDSVINQSYSNWEIIFWDNKSNDHSREIFLKFDDSRLKYFHAEKFTNLSEARNLAIEKANGKLITFLDVDDVWDNNKLLNQYNFSYQLKGNQHEFCLYFQQIEHNFHHIFYFLKLF